MVQLYKYNCEEKKRFQKLVLSGQFYEFLNEQAQKIYKDRGKLKRGFYRQIAFGTVFGLKYGIAAAFQRNFPILFAEIEKMKLKDYKSLAEKLQTFEANIIIKQVVKQARLNNIPILTIHDSVLTDEPHREVLKNIINKAFFDKFGFFPPLKEGI